MTINEELLRNVYCDSRITRLEGEYHGDEITLWVTDTAEKKWKIIFTPCYKVSYERVVPIQNDYYGKSITIGIYEEDKEFMECQLDLSAMTMKVICRGFFIEEDVEG